MIDLRHNCQRMNSPIELTQNTYERVKKKRDNEEGKWYVSALLSIYAIIVHR